MPEKQNVSISVISPERGNCEAVSTFRGVQILHIPALRGRQVAPVRTKIIGFEKKEIIFKKGNNLNV